MNLTNHLNSANNFFLLFRTYFVNHVTRSTQWNRPTRPAEETETSPITPRHSRSSSQGAPAPAASASPSPPAAPIHRRSHSSANPSSDNSLSLAPQPANPQSDLNISLPSEVAANGTTNPPPPVSQSIHKLNSIQNYLEKKTASEMNKVTPDKTSKEPNNRFSNGHIADDTTQVPTSSASSSTTISPTSPKNSLHSEIMNAANNAKSPRNSLIIQNGHTAPGPPAGAIVPTPADRVPTDDVWKLNKVNSGPVSLPSPQRPETLVVDTQTTPAQPSRYVNIIQRYSLIRVLELGAIFLFHCSQEREKTLYVGTLCAGFTCYIFLIHIK